jgi:hypothetical protein
MSEKSMHKRAASLNLVGPLYVLVTELEDDTLDIDAAYHHHELVKTGEKKIVGVYQLVGLQEVTGVETVTIKDLA